MANRQGRVFDAGTRPGLRRGHAQLHHRDHCGQQLTAMKRAFLAAAICQCCVALSVHAVRLNMTRIGEGAITPDVGVYSYSWAKKVTITATPDDGWVVD